MSILRRYNFPGAIYFITNNTHDRQPFLVAEVDLFWLAIETMKKRSLFDLIAWVILPDHFHIIIDPLENNISELMKRIKLSFSMNYRKKQSLKNLNVWQKRFWDHIIRNQDDFNRHIDYIHYNPVKHGLANNPLDYKHSSISKFSEYYQEDWGVTEKIKFNGDYGE